MKFQVSGYWNVNGFCESIPGILYFDDEDRSFLELIFKKGFYKYEKPDISKLLEKRILISGIEYGGFFGETEYSCIDCTIQEPLMEVQEGDGKGTYDKYKIPSTSSVTYSVQKVLRNKLLSPEEKFISEAKIDFPTLRRWIPHIPYKVDKGLGKWTSNEDITIPLEFQDYSIELSLKPITNWQRGAYPKMSIESKAMMTISFKKEKTMNELLELVFCIKNLFSIMEKDVCYLGAFTITQNICESESKQYDLYISRNIYNSRSNKQNNNELISYVDIQDNIEKVFCNWINHYSKLHGAIMLIVNTYIKEDIIHINNVYFSLIRAFEKLFDHFYKSEKFVDQEVFLTLVQQVKESMDKIQREDGPISETLDRMYNRIRSVNSLSLQERIGYITDEYKMFEGSNEIISSLTRIRNDYSHANSKLSEYDVGILLRNSKIVEHLNNYIILKHVFLLDETKTDFDRKVNIESF